MKVVVHASTKEWYQASKDEFDTLSGHGAGMCYLPNTIDSLMNEPKEKTDRRIAGTKNSFHHSVCSHPYVTLTIEGLPKGLAMVLNNEKWYNTSEKSARYTKMVLKDDEQYLYDKWLNIYKTLIKKEYGDKYPQIFTDKKIEKLAQENARYLISVFTPTSMEYTVSYGQLNYIYQMLLNEYNSTSNAFMTALKPAIKELLAEIEKTGYLDDSIRNGVEFKNRKLSLIGSMIKPEKYFGDVYCTSYKGSLAQLAQAQRHRSIDYNITFDEEPSFFVPPIIRSSSDLSHEWKNDCEKQLSVFPQGLMVNINEYGTLKWFVEKLKERKCTFAQLEIDNQCDLLVKEYAEELKRKNHPMAEELAKYTKGSRCTFPDFKCNQPCGFKEGINGTRKI